MAKTYEQIVKQIGTLKAEAEKLRRKEVGEVIARIKQAIEHYGLSATDLGLRAARRAAGTPAPAKKGRAAGRRGKGAKVAPKYRDDAGRTWTGRGLQPVWLREAIAGGRTLKDFEIK